MFRLYYFFAILFVFFPLFGRFIEKTVSVYLIKERINGIEFAHRADTTDGVLQEVWAVNGQSVSYDDYLEAILEAEKEERRLERKKEIAQRKQKEEFRILAQNNAIKKLISHKVDEISKELQAIQNPLLANYLQFNEATFSGQRDLEKVISMAEYAKKSIQENEMHSYDSLKLCLESLEKYPERLHRLYQDSVMFAINTCNDTRILKDLLALLS